MKTAMRKRRSGAVTPAVVFVVTVGGFGVAGFLTSSGISAPGEKSITVHAHKYGYDPEVIRVMKGDTVRLTFISEDVVHGFYLEGYDLDVTIVPLRSTVDLRRGGESMPRERVEEVTFTADREGKFRYRCSQTCGFLHPFMLGDLIVEPNRLLPTGISLAFGVLVGAFLVVLLRPKEEL